MVRLLTVAVVALSFLLFACKPTPQPAQWTPEEMASMEKEGMDPSMMDHSMMGETAPAGPAYLPYSKAAFDQARKDGKVVFLEFHASWCAICRAQEPHIQAAFQAMAQDPRFQNVVGFKVDYDKETDLKREYGITYQHSHVVLGPDGSVKVKSIGEAWDAKTLQAKVAESLPVI